MHTVNRTLPRRTPDEPAETAADAAAQADFRLALLNPWQHGFPLLREPYHAIAAPLGVTPEAVMHGYRSLLADGSLSRIGGVFGAGAGGAGLLAAMAVPPERLEAVAAIVSAHPGVNHNYEREDHWNLWFVMTGRDTAAVAAAMDGLERDTGLAALRLRMRRAYRIDLGFDLQATPHGQAAARTAGRPSVCGVPPVAEADWPLAALSEAGLPQVAQPYDCWAGQLGRPVDELLATLARWVDAGTLRRFGTVVRHHELGWNANAMTVFDVPDHQVDACGAALARMPGVTLAYCRERAPGWPYNLYCMVHGRDRDAVAELIDAAIGRCELAGHARAVLFSRRRFKQTGARRFRDRPAAQLICPATAQEVEHVCA